MRKRLPRDDTLRNVKGEARVFSNHEEARTAQITEWARMSKERRLAVGAELHAFWVMNHFPDAVRMDRTVRVARRAK